MSMTILTTIPTGQTVNPQVHDPRLTENLPCVKYIVARRRHIHREAVRRWAKLRRARKRTQDGIRVEQQPQSEGGREIAAPDRPAVVVCVDGFEPEYAEAALDHGKMPAFARMRKEGAYTVARGVMPSFTNPNNMSIVTAETPARHGISGNYFYDERGGREVPMSEPEFVRADTVLKRHREAGLKVGAVTAKDKLRRMLGAGWKGVCFSGEMADRTSAWTHGITDVEAKVGMAKPGMYSGLMSDFVMRCGEYLVETGAVDVLYLSLTDFIQHTYAPGTPEADEFFARLDARLARLDELGATVVVTGDHGMNDKSLPDGSPNVVHIETLLKGAVRGRLRVVLPITDPHVTHHAGLGSFATVHLDGQDREKAKEALLSDRRIERVLAREEAAAELDLPADRIGDLVVLSGRDSVLGKSAEFHDLSALKGRRLRSHGGLHETRVPFLVNRPLKRQYEEKLHSATSRQAFDFALRGVA